MPRDIPPTVARDRLRADARQGVGRWVKLAGYVLTHDQWAALEPRIRTQLLQVSLGLDDAWQLQPGPRARPVALWPEYAATSTMPAPTAEPGPEPETVIIHAAAPTRPPTVPPRRAARTSDID